MSFARYLPLAFCLACAPEPARETVTPAPRVPTDGSAGREASRSDSFVAADRVAAPQDVRLADTVVAARTTCRCFLGDGPYCAARAAAEAKRLDCDIPDLAKYPNDLFHCAGGVWKRGEDCPASCKYTATSTKLDDACELPVCPCFVKEAWCGASVGTTAVQMRCRVPLLPAKNDDILHCPGGQWAVKQDCAKGCQSNPPGTPDACKSESSYKLPLDCRRGAACTNGNHTALHDGKDEYAYDFGIPVGTRVRAMRGGTVLRVRNVSGPGDPCYDSGGSACANLANTVEIKHSDGSVGLYMHLRVGTVRAGATVQQGDPIGESGNSGWSTGPHVHVQVQSDCGIWWCQSVPLRFVEGTVGTGSTITSANCP